jgi:hypothetical protein
MQTRDIVATSLQIAYAGDFSSENFTFSLWRWVLVSQFVQCITIITSCIPYLRPLLEAFPSGMYMSDEIRRKGTTTGVSAGESYMRTPGERYILRDMSKAGTDVSLKQITYTEGSLGLGTTTRASGMVAAQNSSTDKLWNQGPGIVKTTTFATS